MPAMLRNTLAALAVAAAIIAPQLNLSAAGAFTVTEHKVARGGAQFEVRCGQPETKRWKLPEGAERIRVLEPVVGQVLKDGFGDREVATIQDVQQRVDGDRTVVEITAVGSGQACEPIGDAPASNFAWETDSVDFRARYDRVSNPSVFVSDEQGGLNPREQPARLTAAYKTGWRKLNWRKWGGDTAVARGRFHAMHWVAIGYTDVEEREVSYPVRVTLSRIRRCGGGRYYYTRIETEFLSRAPKDIRRQAKPPGTAGCLD